MSILIQAPDMGLNALLPENMLDPRHAAKWSRNMLYERGFLRAAYGYAKVDLTTTGLNSGQEVVSLFPFEELDGYSHLMAVTPTKLYENDKNNSTWKDRTQSGAPFAANVDSPVSYIQIAHNDTDIYIDDGAGTLAYYHLVVCDGGNSDIQRWAGRYEATAHDVVGAGGYHDGTTHRAKQVGQFQSRMLLISPKYYSSSSKTWSEQNQRIQYPTVGKLQTWTGTGSGFVDLNDTGGSNVWSAPLGGQYVVYQTRGIWSLNHVGGSGVFSPYPYIPDLGLLAPHLLVVKNNVHYFMGTDYNLYAYAGGTSKQPIGDNIRQYIEDEISSTFIHRCWMSLDQHEKRLWVFIVCDGDTYITKAYGIDLRTGAGMMRDFRDIYTGTTSGITAVNLVGSQTYVLGDTYQNVLNLVAVANGDTTDSGTAGDVTVRYGDVLTDTTTDWAGDWSDVAIDAGGQDFSLAVGTFDADFTENDILLITDGSEQTNISYGRSYYTVYDVSGNGFSVYTRGRADGVDYGIADVSTDVPAFDATAKSYIWLLRDPGGQAYEEDIERVLVDEKLHMGDGDGFVYQFDETHTLYGDVFPNKEHATPVVDLQQPDLHKRWPGIAVVAKGDYLKVEYRVSNFDTSETGWVVC